MSNLREKIENAWKNGTSVNWKYIGSGNLSGEKLSANTIAYGQLWEVTLHYNNCKPVCTGQCWSGTENLVKERIGCIQRGMPDLHPDTESDIWRIAFELHTAHSHKRPGAITPTWIDGDKTDCCDCFEKAMAQYFEQIKPKKKVALTEEFTEEDRWYEPRFE